MRNLRVLCILIHRQITDDGHYLIIALSAVSVSLCIAACFGMFSDPNPGYHLPAPTVSFLALVLLISVYGSYLFGFAQRRGDRAGGVSELLSSMPIHRHHILLARVITGIVFLLVVLLFSILVLTGAIWLDILPGQNWMHITFGGRWPSFLFVKMMADVLLAILLTAFACYCLSFRKARGDSALLSALAGWSVLMILVSLIVIKGFGWPFLAVLLPLIVASLIYTSRPPAARPVAVVSLGLVVGILFSTGLFVGRYVCDAFITGTVPDDARTITLTPSSLLSPGVEAKVHSVISGKIEKYVQSFFLFKAPYLWRYLGVLDYVPSRLPESSPIYVSGSGHLWFDKGKGQVIVTGQLWVC